VEKPVVVATIGSGIGESTETREKKAGGQEYRECRRNPSHRRLSWLAQAGNRSRIGLWILGVNVRHPGLARFILRFLSRMPGMQASASAVLRSLDRLVGACETAGGWSELKAFFWRTLPILVYHHVGPYVPGTFRFLTIEPGAFARQLEWLRKRGFTAIHLRDWTDWLDRGDPLPKKPVIVTFDDAYADIARYALPELRSRGMGATVYVVTGLTGGTNSWDLRYVRSAHSLMSQQEIRLWSRNNIEIGCHTRSHRWLVDLDKRELEIEVRGSADELACIVNGTAESFAYPYGVYDRGALERVSAVFGSAVTTCPGMNSLWTPRHQLRRANVDPQHQWFDFPFLVWFGRGPYETLHVFLAQKKKALYTKVRNLIRPRGVAPGERDSV
jgi:peptidoglycan/xylan/chitin deacetylase (PgdA/CDA1 family)